jgi:hypothetical protein
MVLSRLPKTFLVSIVLLVAAALASCAGAPVQQMYDARQAIRAAEKAGAAQYAPDLLAEAQAHLKSARANIDTQEYRTARDEAELARAKAIEARRQAEAAAAKPHP